MTVTFSYTEMGIVLRALRQLAGHVKHGGGSDWREYVAVEEIAQRIVEVANRSPDGFCLTFREAVDEVDEVDAMDEGGG